MEKRRQPLIYLASTPADQDLCNELIKHLRQPCRAQGAELWCDLDIMPGDERGTEIATHVALADLVLLLVSVDLLSDERVWDLVIKPAMGRHEAKQTVVVPIRLRPAGWHGAPFAKIEPLPKGGQALTEATNLDRALADLVEQILEVMERLLGSRLVAEGGAITTPPAPITRRAAELATVAFSEQMLKLADALSKELDHRLDELRESYRNGEQAAALSSIRELCKHEAWNNLEPALRGKVLRTRAIYELHAGTGLDEIKDLIAQAAAMDPDGDDRTVRAFLALWDSDWDEALRITSDADALAPYNFHVALLLEAQRLEEARNCLGSFPQGIEPDAETKRLSAILALMSGDVPLAREWINAALSLQPHWVALRETSAIIDFWGGCAPVALMANPSHMPHPFPVEFIRLDDEARDRRRRAANLFATLARDFCESPGRPRYQFWQFVCLAQERETASKAESLFSDLLGDHEHLPLLVSWAIARDIEFDRDATEKALRQANPASRNYLDCIGQLCGLLASSNRGDEALALLDLNKDGFVAAEAIWMWRHWRVQALLSAGRYEEAEDEARQQADPKARRDLLTACADYRYTSGGDWRPLFELFDEGYKESNSISLLLNACRLKGQAGEWDYVYGHVEALLAQAPTLPTIHLAAAAAWNCNFPGRCREILEQHEDRFPEKRLPEDLRRLRISCLRRDGLLNEAIECARADWERARSWDSLVTLLEVQMRQGDFAGLVETAPALLGFADGNALQLLQVVEWVRVRQADLARNLWRQAVKFDSEDATFPMAAIFSGMALGFHGELQPLWERASRLADEGLLGMRRIALEEMPALMASTHEQTQVVWKSYDQGQIGIYWLGSSRQPLVHILHTVPAANRCESNPWRRAAILVRHGMRPARVFGKGYSFGGRLVMDVTALIVAHDTGLLDQVELLFAPVLISPRLPMYLGKEIHDLQPRQPDRLDAIERVNTLVRLHVIGLINETSPDDLPAGDFYRAVGAEWLGWVETLRQDGGALMEFAPLTSNDLKHAPLEIPACLAPYVTSPRAVLEKLHADGRIDDGRYQKALSIFGSVAFSGAEMACPGIGQRLLVLPEIAVLLEQAGILELIAELYRLEMPRRQWENNYPPELLARDRDQRAIAWLETLLGRIQDGLRKGIYRAIPEGPVFSKDETEIPLGDITICGLWDLLHYQGDPTDLVWVDDRWFSSFPNVNRTPTVGIFDVLQLLRKPIGEEAYFRKLSTLRASNYSHLPIFADEILYWLRKASVVKGRIQETKELVLLRQYWAKLLLESERLQIAIDDNGKCEVGLISQSLSTVQKALNQIWSDSLSYPRRLARAQWVLENLYTDLIHLDHLAVEPTNPESRRVRVGLGISALLSNGLSLNNQRLRSNREKPSVQEQYMDWIAKAVIVPRVTADPECSVSAGELLGRSIESTLDEFNKKNLEYRRFAQALLHRFIRLLPEVMRNEVQRNGGLMAKLGLGVCEVVAFDSYQFAAKDFWSAGAQALRDGDARLQDITGHVYSLRKGGQGIVNASLMLANDKGDIKLNIVNPMIGILSPHAAERRAVLDLHPEWLDGTAEGIEAKEIQLGDIESPMERVSLVTAWQGGSAASFYIKLGDAMHEENVLNSECFLPPSTTSLLRYFRLEVGLSDSVSFAHLWDRATKRMLHELGILETLTRAVCLPVPLPMHLLEELRGMADAENHFEQLLPTATSPISILHLIDLGLGFGNRVTGIDKAVGEHLSCLQGRRYMGDYKVMQSILSLAQRSLENRKDFRELPGALQLALIWGHALATQNRLQCHVTMSEQTAEVLNTCAGNLPLPAFGKGSDFENDVACPSLVHHPHLIYHALGRILSRHPAKYWKSCDGLNSVKSPLKSFIDGGGGDGMALFLARQTQRQTDFLDSWFGGCRKTALEPLLGGESEWFASDRRRADVLASLGQLEQMPNAGMQWALLFGLLVNADIDDELKPRCTAIARSVDLNRLYSESPDQALMGARLIFTWLNDFDAGKERLIQVVREREAFISADTEPQNDARRFASWITECAYWLSRCQGDGEAFDQRFSDLMQHLLRESAAFANAMAPVITSLSRQISAVDYPGLLRLALAVRMRA